MKELDFITGGTELLDDVQPLWEGLNAHHKANSRYFKEKFEKLTFDVRKKKFINAKDTEIRVDLVKDTEKQKFIGYCISTVNGELTGEIDSLYIEQEYRKYGLGNILMQKSLEWLGSKNVTTRIIVVAEGNEQVLGFYRKYGFYERRIVLEQLTE